LLKATGTLGKLLNVAFDKNGHPFNVQLSGCEALFVRPVIGPDGGEMLVDQTVEIIRELWKSTGYQTRKTAL
jgi:hypothetical protein